MNTAPAARYIAPGLLAVFAATAPANAQEAKYRLGLQANFAMPTGTAIYSEGGEKWFENFLSMGFGASAFFEWGLGGNGSVRGRLEYLAFGDSAQERESNLLGIFHSFSRMSYDMTIMGLGADYVHGFRSIDAGPYVFGGLGYYSTKGSGNIYTRVTMPPLGPDFSEEGNAPMDGSGSSLGLSIGAGYRFTRNLGCEARFTMLNGLKQTLKVGEDPEPGDEDTKLKTDLSWLQVSFCYRF
jgi:hypothetical protein